MKRFWSFFRKELNHIFRDTRTMIILFGMPIAQVLIFGYVVSNEIRDARLMIIDLAKNEISADISRSLQASGYFIAMDSDDSNISIEEALRSSKAQIVVVLGQHLKGDFKQGITPHIQIIADASDPNTADILVNYTRLIITKVFGKYRLDNSVQLIEIIPRMYYNEELKSAFMFIPGTMAMIMMLISAMMTSISITREKELGTMDLLLVSPLKPIQIILGKVMPYIGLSFINVITIIGLGYWVFDLPVAGSVSLLLAESVLFIIMSLALGVFISTVSPNQQVAMFVSMFALMLPTILLSGFIFPIKNMPLWLQWFSALMPPRYYIVIVKNIMLKGLGLGFVWKETLILAGITIVFISLSIRNFKLREK